MRFQNLKIITKILFWGYFCILDHNFCILCHPNSFCEANEYNQIFNLFNKWFNKW